MKKPQPSAAASLLDLVSSTKPRASSSDSDESESGQGTSGSSSDATSSSEESSSENSELARLRRKARTEKARASYMKNVTERKTRMKLEKNQLLPNSHPAAKFLKDVAPHSKDEITKAGSSKTDAMTRTRLLWSWFTSFYASITSFLHSGHSFGHVINLCVIDDTNMRLAVPKTDRWGLGGSSRVIAIMNNIQTLIFRYGQSDDPENKDKLRTFFVHTPMVPLERSNANGILSEFVSWIFVWLGCIGKRWKRFSQPAAGSSPQVPIRIQALGISWDSLKTNNAVLKSLRRLAVTHAQKQTDGEPQQIFPMIAARCGLHQVALCRKGLLFHFSAYWSTIVRLAHLFEANTFRNQFRKALIQVVSSSFDYIVVSEMPSQHSEWQQSRRELFSRRFGMPDSEVDGDEDGSTSTASSKRKMQEAWFEELSTLNNSDPSSRRIAHWCLQGSCGCGGRKAALLRICQLYVSIFGKGFAVPLTYRWLHSEDALHYTTEF
jgi:hypothetical protein